MKEISLPLLVLLVGLVLYTLDDARDVDPYCEMVGIYNETNGQYGWPDYRGNADEVCDE